MAVGSAPMTLGQATDLLDLSIQDKSIKTALPDEQYRKYFNYVKNNDYYYKDSGISGLGIADFVDENGVITADVPVQNYKQTYTMNEVSAFTSFTSRMWMFGIQRNDLTAAADQLKTMIARAKEQLCAERLDNIFSSTYTHTGIGGARSITITGGDGLAGVTSAHTREDGGTNMNNGVYDGTTYNLPFDYSGLKAAFRTAGLMVDPRGNPMIPDLTTLVVKKNSNVHTKAMELLGAMSRGRIPESNDNDGVGVPVLTIIALPYLTNGSYWHMHDPSMMKNNAGFQFVEARPVFTEPAFEVYKTSEIQKKARSIFDLGFNDLARSWVSSKGDSSSLS